MIKSVNALAAALLVVGGAAASVAAGQIRVPQPIRITPPANYSNILVTREIGRVAAGRLARSRGTVRGADRGRGAAPGKPKAGPATSASGTTTFVPGDATILPARLAARTPAHREEAARFFSGLLSTYRDLLREKRATQNDVARAVSFALANSFSVYNDGRFLTDRQLTGLRTQMHDAFAEDTQFQRLTNREKQELYESYVIAGMYMSAMFDSARREGNRTVLAAMKNLARTQLEETLSVSVDRMVFTDAGITYGAK